MSWTIRFSKRAENYLKKLDRKSSVNILNKISKLKDNPWALPYKKLRGHEDFYRIRIGDFRVIYHVDKKINEIHIARIEKRSKAYRNIK